MDIYKSSLKYAKENGELERYRESMNLCDECGMFINDISEEVWGK